MGKQKKKRTKRYSGSDAKVVSPTVMRVSAEERGPFKEWWLGHQMLIRVGGTVLAIVLFIAICIVGLIGILGG